VLRQEMRAEIFVFSWACHFLTEALGKIFQECHAIFSLIYANWQKSHPVNSSTSVYSN